MSNIKLKQNHADLLTSLETLFNEDEGNAYNFFSKLFKEEGFTAISEAISIKERAKDNAIYGLNRLIDRTGDDNRDYFIQLKHLADKYLKAETDMYNQYVKDIQLLESLSHEKAIVSFQIEKMLDNPDSDINSTAFQRMERKDERLTERIKLAKERLFTMYRNKEDKE